MATTSTSRDPTDTPVDSKKLIADSYNTIASRYFSWSSPRPTLDRAGYIKALGELIPRGSKVVELGCGAGVPATRQLVDLGFDVMGVDVSSELIDIARREVEGAHFQVNDMLDFVNRELDTASTAGYKRPQAILAFYTIWHLPPAEQILLIQRCMELLAPGGWLILNMMTNEGEIKMDEWLGAPMISWGLGVKKNQEIFKRLFDLGVLSPDEVGDMGKISSVGISTSWEGVVRMEKVGNMEHEMHWFCVQKAIDK